ARITQAIARTADREALLVEQRADTTDEQHFVVLVIAAVAAPLHWLELREFLFPIAQHVRLDLAQVADFANGEVALGGNRGKCGSGFGTSHVRILCRARAAFR